LDGLIFANETLVIPLPSAKMVETVKTPVLRIDSAGTVLFPNKADGKNP
jgi:hypothetical protein